MFHVTRTIERKIKEINDYDSKKNRIFSQNIPDMKENLKSIRNRVNKIEEDKNENEDEVILKIRSKIQASDC